MSNHKYRVWCKDKNEWEKNASLLGEYGDLFHFTHNTIMPYKPENHIVVFYTGLKDTNGVEIFEGDIVDLSDIAITSFKSTVEFRRGMFLDNYYGFALDGYKFIKVIGNIYENQELLN